jgi:hypothetical protein
VRVLDHMGFFHSLIHSFDKHQVSGRVVGLGDTARNKSDPNPGAARAGSPR